MELLKISTYLKTLSININGTTYELGNIVILDDENKIMVKKTLYDVLPPGFSFDIEVKRRLKLETALKNNDKAFILKREDKSFSWSDTNVYDLYMKNELLDFRLEKVSKYGGDTLTLHNHYHSKKHDINFIDWESFTNATTKKYDEEVRKFYDMKEKHLTSSNTKEIIEHAKNLIKNAKNMESLHKQAKSQLAEEVEKRNAKIGVKS